MMISLHPVIGRMTVRRGHDPTVGQMTGLTAQKRIGSRICQWIIVQGTKKS